jgi:Zn-dependent protease
MKKIKIGIGGVLMLGAMMLSERAELFAVFLTAAVAHELGHLIAAKVMRIGVKEIRLDTFGARICVEERLLSYKQELWLALSGPVANLATAMIAFFALPKDSQELFFEIERFASSGEWHTGGAAGFFILSSLIQAAINLLPIKSFDGGRALQCLLSLFVSETAAERIVEISSAISVGILWMMALYLMLKTSSGLELYAFSIGLFFMLAGRQSLSHTDANEKSER